MIRNPSAAVRLELMQEALEKVERLYEMRHDNVLVEFFIREAVESLEDAIDNHKHAQES